MCLKDLQPGCTLEKAGFDKGCLMPRVGVDMSRFRAFPYRGSLLRSQTGAVQEVSHPPHPLCTAGTPAMPGARLHHLRLPKSLTEL